MTYPLLEWKFPFITYFFYFNGFPYTNFLKVWMLQI